MIAYLDNAATTPLDPNVLEEMMPFLVGVHGNPSSSHSAGRLARQAVERARGRVATPLGVAPAQVIFTSGGSEANNLAVKGLAWAGREAGRGSHIVTTAIEHLAVLSAARWLVEKQGFTLDVVPPRGDGVMDPDRLLQAVREDTVLVSMMAANNELGTVQPVREVSSALREREIAFHTDAVQAFGRMDLPVSEWGISALTMSAHKINGPKGVGVLIVDDLRRLEPLVHGGGQEAEIRSGTINTPGVVGCGAAVHLAVANMHAEGVRLARLRDRLAVGLLAVPGVRGNGSQEHRLPTNAHVFVEGCRAQDLLMALDAEDVQVSAGSACSSQSDTLSHVLRAINAPMEGAHLRFTCGRSTTDEDVDQALSAFAPAVERCREAIKVPAGATANTPG